MDGKMKLTKKHIGQFFDVKGADGSWYYQLLDIKGKKLLFKSSTGHFEIDTNKLADWRPVDSLNLPHKEIIKHGWEIGRYSPYVRGI